MAQNSTRSMGEKAWLGANKLQGRQVLLSVKFHPESVAGSCRLVTYCSFSLCVEASAAMVYGRIASATAEPQIHFLIVCAIKSPQSFRHLVVPFYLGLLCFRDYSLVTSLVPAYGLQICSFVIFRNSSLVGPAKHWQVCMCEDVWVLFLFLC